MSSSSSSSAATASATNNSTTPSTTPTITTFLAPNSPESTSTTTTTTSTSKNNGDSTFEPTVDMMVNDFDDEQTLEEEEALAAQEFEDPSAELSNLQKESDMPIEELLALYNCNGALLHNLPGVSSNNTSPRVSSSASMMKRKKLKPQRMASTSSSTTINDAVSEECSTTATTINESSDNNISVVADQNEDEENEDDEIEEEGDDEEDDEDEEDDDDHLKTSHLRKLYPETYGNDKRLLRTISRQQSDEDDDGEYSPDEDEFKKTIMVGSEFQAVIPEGFFKYDDVLPYENEDKLLWEPSRLSEKQTEEYLTKVKSLNSTNSDTIPHGSHLRDDEQALYLLLQCGYNTEEALRRKRLNPVPVTTTSEEMSIWSEDECRNFESGIRIYGKDFYTIKHTKVKTRSVGELVQFYYLWKKTERHDVFANKARLEKKKYSLHPGLTDYMDRFLEEQECNNSNNTGGSVTNNTVMNLRDRSSSPGVVNSLLQADTKRHNLKIHHHHHHHHLHHHHHHYGGNENNGGVGSSNTDGTGSNSNSGIHDRNPTGKLINSKGHHHHLHLNQQHENYHLLHQQQQQQQQQHHHLSSTLSGSNQSGDSNINTAS